MRWQENRRKETAEEVDSILLALWITSWGFSFQYCGFGKCIAPPINYTITEIKKIFFFVTYKI